MGLTERRRTPVTRLRSLFLICVYLCQLFPLPAWAARELTISVLESAPTQDAYGRDQVHGTADFIMGKIRKSLNRDYDGSKEWIDAIKDSLAKENKGKPPVEVIRDPDGKFRFLDGHHSNKTRELLARLLYPKAREQAQARGVPISEATFIDAFLNDPQVKVQVRELADFSRMVNKTEAWTKFAVELLSKNNGYLTQNGMRALITRYPEIGLWETPWEQLSTDQRRSLSRAVGEAFRAGHMPNSFVEGRGTQLNDNQLRSLVGDVMRLRNINGTAFENFVQFPLARLIEARAATDPRLATILANTNYNQKRDQLLTWLYETREGQDVIMELTSRVRPGGTETAALVQVLNSFGVHLRNELKTLDPTMSQADINRLARQWLQEGRVPAELRTRFESQPNRLSRLGELEAAVDRRRQSMADYIAGRRSPAASSSGPGLGCIVVGGMILGGASIGGGLLVGNLIDSGGKKK